MDHSSRSALYFLVICCLFWNTVSEETRATAVKGLKNHNNKAWNIKKQASKQGNLKLQLPFSVTARKLLRNTSKLHLKPDKKPPNGTTESGIKVHGSSSGFLRLQLKKRPAQVETSTKKSEKASDGCSTKLDIGFIMGGCGSESFEPCTSFAKTVINKLTEHSINAHFGLILFSKRAKILINLEENQLQSEVLQELNAIEYKENKELSKLKVGKALQLANDLFGNARKDSKKIAILVTGGKAVDDIVVPSQHLKTSGVSIFGVGLGNQFERTQLEILANTPNAKFVYTLDPRDVTALVDQIMNNFCIESKTAAFTFVMNDSSEDSKDYRSGELISHKVNEYTDTGAENGNEDPAAYLKFLASLNQALPPWTNNNLDSWQAVVKESNKNHKKEEDNDDGIMKSPDYYEHLVNKDADYENDAPQGNLYGNTETKDQQEIVLDKDENKGRAENASIILKIMNNTWILPIKSTTNDKEPEKTSTFNEVINAPQNDPQDVVPNTGSTGNSQNGGNSGNSQGGNNGNNQGMNNGNNQGGNNGNNQGGNNGNSQGGNNGNNQGGNNGNNQGGNNGNNQGGNNENNQGGNNENNQGGNNGNNQGMNNGNNQGGNNGNNQGMNNGNNQDGNNGNNQGGNNGNNQGGNNGNNQGGNNGNNQGGNNGNNQGMNNGNNQGMNNGNNQGGNNGNNQGGNNGNNQGGNNGNSQGGNNGNNQGMNNGNNQGGNNGNNQGGNNGNNQGGNNGNNQGGNNGNNQGMNNGNNQGMNNGNNQGMNNGNNQGMNNGNNQGGNNGNNQGGSAMQPISLLGIIPIQAVSGQGNQPNNGGNPMQSSNPQTSNGEETSPQQGNQSPSQGQQQPGSTQQQQPNNSQPSNGGQTNPQQGNQSPNQGQQQPGSPANGGGQTSPNGQGSQGQSQPTSSPSPPGQKNPSTSPQQPGSNPGGNGSTTPDGQTTTTAMTPQPGSGGKATAGPCGTTAKPTMACEGGSTVTPTRVTQVPKEKENPQNTGQGKNGKKEPPILTLPGFMIPLPMKHPHPMRLPNPYQHVMHRFPRPDLMMNPFPGSNDHVLIGQCQDLDPGCPSMALSGFCDREAAKYNCMASCGYCRSFVKFGEHVALDARHKTAKGEPRFPKNYPEYSSQFLRSIITRPKMTTSSNESRY